MEVKNKMNTIGNDKKIGFSDLTTSLKVLVICCWIITGIFGLSFIAGYVAGILGY